MYSITRDAFRIKQVNQIHINTLTMLIYGRRGILIIEANAKYDRSTRIGQFNYMAKLSIWQRDLYFKIIFNSSRLEFVVLALG